MVDGCNTLVVVADEQEDDETDAYTNFKSRSSFTPNPCNTPSLQISLTI